MIVGRIIKVGKMEERMERAKVRAKVKEVKKTAKARVRVKTAKVRAKASVSKNGIQAFVTNLAAFTLTLLSRDSSSKDGSSSSSLELSRSSHPVVKAVPVAGLRKMCCAST